ncbi:hypothetical protein MTR67_034250 [Solanum verrucosum]|uniref:Tf2-1-like SH3-like domain-containing protein n=1 Tax=Solanum verrucosum TaxID=315347 RepID=A0AAF0ZK62_SOLVR|nr:hypothetical protein MTR67_034250 [Solanum verrucosum]
MRDCSICPHLRIFSYKRRGRRARAAGLRVWAVIWVGNLLEFGSILGFSFCWKKKKVQGELEFEVDDWVYLKVSPMKGVMRFGKKGKLNPQYIGPYRIAYELELSHELAAVHSMFHISMLKKCMGYPSLIIPIEDIEINDSLSYEEIPV